MTSLTGFDFRFAPADNVLFFKFDNVVDAIEVVWTVNDSARSLAPFSIYLSGQIRMYKIQVIC